MNKFLLGLATPSLYQSEGVLFGAVGVAVPVAARAERGPLEISVRICLKKKF